MVEIADQLDKLRSMGASYFTRDEIEERLGSSRQAVSAALRRARKRGLIAMPRRGFYLILPPEQRPYGCLPPSQFIPHLMDHLGRDYYVGLLSAGEYHGAAHHRPQRFQVMVDVQERNISCGEIAIDFHRHQRLAQIPVVELMTRSGYLKVSTPEATAFDLVGFERWAAGLENVATVLVDLVEEINGSRLARVSRIYPVAWVQRLGHLIEAHCEGVELEPLAREVERRHHKVVGLHPGTPVGGKSRDERWKVAINIDLEPDR